ncbi:hypothetical protein VTK73DRAFT_8446 [Phialemonium thermophilum]|uniref:Transposase n=1 Tax=Phialemonium thermophilum TaxID=223376 RepID=A0ABR3XNQ0_9PEZI
MFGAARLATPDASQIGTLRRDLPQKGTSRGNSMWGLREELGLRLWVESLDRGKPLARPAPILPGDICRLSTHVKAQFPWRMTPVPQPTGWLAYERFTSQFNNPKQACWGTCQEEFSLQ